MLSLTQFYFYIEPTKQELSHRRLRVRCLCHRINRNRFVKSFFFVIRKLRNPVQLSYFLLKFSGTVSLFLRID